MPDTLAAFFSYSRQDSDFTLRLARDLKAAGASVWIDQLDIEPGLRWDDAVDNALKDCPRMLVVLSPVSVKSDNVRDEVSFALSKQKRVIPVLYRECDVPFRLARLQHIDFRTEYEQGLKALLRVLGVEQAMAASAAPAPATPKEAHPAPADTGVRRMVAEQVEVEVERRLAAERARLEEERKRAAEQARLEEQRQAAAEKARLEQQERERLTAAEQARLEEERKRAAERARVEQERAQAAEQVRLEEERNRAAEQARLEKERRRAAAERAIEEELERAEAQGRLDVQRKQAAQQAWLEEKRRQAAELAQSEEGHRQAAEQVRLAEERKQAAEQARMEEQRRQAAAEKARLEQEERERLAAAVPANFLGVTAEPSPSSPSSSLVPTSLFPASIWGRAVVIGLIWAAWLFFVPFASGGLGLYPFHPLNAFFIGAGFGLSLGLFLKKTMPSFRWPHVAGMVVSWCLALFLGRYVNLIIWRTFHVYRVTGPWTWQIYGGAVAGGMIALIVRNAQKELTLKQALVIAGGYLSAAVMALILLPVPHSFAVYLFDCAASGLILGLIGGGVMFWQLSKVGVKQP